MGKKLLSRKKHQKISQGSSSQPEEIPESCLNAINSDISSITLPVGWIRIRDVPHIVLCNTIYTSNNSAAVKFTITILDDFIHGNVKYYEKVIKTCNNLSPLPSQVCNVGVILQIIKKLSVTKVCTEKCGDKF